MTPVILYGGTLSPFVRRVELWLALQQRPYERRPVRVLAKDFDGITAVNPVGRVPVLTIGEGQNLIETFAITDYLEDTAPDGHRLIPAAGAARRECMQRIAYANSVAEKGVALVYETVRRPTQAHWPHWQERLRAQVRGGLEVLETLTPEDEWNGGERPDGADIAIACAYDFVTVMHPALIEGLDRLAAFSAHANAVPVFKRTYPVES